MTIIRVITVHYYNVHCFKDRKKIHETANYFMMTKAFRTSLQSAAQHITYIKGTKHRFQSFTNGDQCLAAGTVRKN